MNRLLPLRVMLLMLVSGLSILAGCNGASNRALELVGKDGDKGFMFKELKRGDHVRKYGLFVPLTYKSTQKYPVIIFLQGIGEGAGLGEGDGKNMTVGLGPFVALQRENFPFIVIFVQSGGSWSADSIYADDVITALDDVSKQYSVDQDRVSLTGLSTGGYGTYVIGAKFHDRFAALVPMGSNGADTHVADKLTGIAVRAYCSESGDIFAGSNDQSMVEKIKSLGGRAEFIQTPTSGHDCWEYVYGSGDLFVWLQEQRRHTSNSASLSPPARSSSSAVPIMTPIVNPPATPGARATVAASPY